MIALSHETLENYYQLNFQLMHHYNYSLNEIEKMLPYEREIYASLLEQHLKEERIRQETTKNG